MIASLIIASVAGTLLLVWALARSTGNEYLDDVDISEDELETDLMGYCASEGMHPDRRVF